MVRLPRRHVKLGAKLGRSDELASRPGDQPTGALVKWPATTAALRSQAEFEKSRRGRRAIRNIFDFQLPIADWTSQSAVALKMKKAIGNRQLEIGNEL